MHRPHFTGKRWLGARLASKLSGDQIEIVIDRAKLTGTVNLVGDADGEFGAEEGTRRLAARKSRGDLKPHPALPEDTKLWAALVHASGGVCVYDAESIVAALDKTAQ